MSANILTVFSKAERIYGFLLFVFASIMVIYQCVQFNYERQLEQATKSANYVTRSIDSKVSEVRTMMSSLVGMHYASISLDNGELLGYSETLKEQAPFLNALGRYDAVSGENREEFEDSMNEKGLFNFQIMDIGDTDESTPSPEANIYYPISMLEPMNPENLRMIGANLSTVPTLASELDRISLGNESLITALPPSWPLGGQLIMFTPVYSGNQAPDQETERSIHFDGGFWISANIDSTLDTKSESLEGFIVQIDVINPKGAETLFEQSLPKADEIHLSAIYDPISIKNQWQIDSSTIVVTMTKTIGLSVEAIVWIMTVLVSVALIMGLVALFINHKRSQALERQHGKDIVFAEREKAERTLNSIKDAIVTLDKDHRVVHLNPAANELFSRSTPQMFCQSFSSMFSFRPLDNSFERLSIDSILDELENDGKSEFDVHPVDFSTPDAIFRLSIVTTATPDGVTTGHILMLRDISNERRLNQKLEFQANHDALTGCTNRYYFEGKLGELIDDLENTDRKHAICYMDLDQFKVVNDTCGHRAGDRLLKELTKNLKSLTREYDVLSRLGGDEFGLIVTDINPAGAKAISEKVFEFFQNYVFQHEDKAFAVRACIGVVFIDQNSGTLSDVLSAADIACYEAKARGRNGLCFYSEDNEIMSERSDEMNWIPHLQRSLANDCFQLHVQSVASIGVEFPESPVTHYEFLLRMVQDDGTEITPWQIIQAAERYDLMRDIDRWVVKNAIKIVAGLPSEIAGKYTFSINLSGQSSADPNLIDYIREQFVDFNVSPSLFWFELTETAAISHFSVAYDLFKDIRSLGAKVAMDDFGSGLSSFSYLKTLPVDIIKIDGQFVKDIATDRINREMVKAIHHVGRSMGIQTVAEFVETAEAVDELINIGVNYAQGYYIAKPCPVHEAFNLLSYKRVA